jgi:hypothetical protein
VNLRWNSVVLLALVVCFAAGLAFAQEQTTKKQEPNTKKEAKKGEKPAPAPAPVISKDSAAKPATAEQVAETVIAIYGFPGGRNTLNQIRKTTVEKGHSNITNSEGKVEAVNYQRWIIRGDSLEKEKIRLDQEFPNARYALILNEEKIFGIFNDSVFTPREDASRSFENQVVRGLEALLRYKENESKLELAGREKLMGVDFYQLDVTDKQGRTTRFYISAKSFRVMMLEYEEAGVKFRRKFYNYNYAQGTLVPYRSVLWADDKVIEESEISTITFGQKVDDELFKAG